MANLIGRMLGRYQILELLGEGGMASVYKAYDTRLGRYVAVKVLHPLSGSDPAPLRRFELEARSLAQLSHPAIVRVLDYGDQDGRPYLVLEYIPAGTLKDRLAAQNGRPMPWREAAGFLAPIARALETAHRHNIIHRDVKPSNILISDTGQPLLSDFGIAKTLESNITPDLTGAGVRMGTPEYMSPEQCTVGAVDFRTDIYSLGIVFYEMVTGRKPFTGDSGMAVMHQQVYDPLPPPGQFASLPRDVEAVLYRALAKDPGARFASMGEFAAALESLASTGRANVSMPAEARVPAASPPTDLRGYGRVPAGPPPTGYAPPGYAPPPRAPRWFGRLLLALVLAAIAILVVASLLAAARPLWQRLISLQLPSLPNLSLPTSAARPTATRKPAQPATTDWQQGRLAFVQRQGNVNAIYMMPMGGDTRLLFGAAGKNAFGAAWSPDGQHVAYYIYPEDLRVLDVNAEDSSTSIGQCNVPSWSGDGSRIICRAANQARLLIYDAEGGGLVGQMDFAGGAVPAWSPSRADEIALAVFSGKNTAIYRLSLDSGESVELASQSSENYAPAWSPDGEQIAYQSNQDSDNSEIWVMDRDGNNPRRVTESPAGSWSRAPSWSPDGRWLAFVSSQAGSIGPDYGEIFVVSLESGEVIQVSNTGGRVYDWRVSWAK